jgi:putative membrane protein (TIGR04086 family)
MQYDPRQTGSPPTPIEPSGFFTGIQIRPVIMGVIVDTIATIALISLYYSLYAAPGRVAGKGVAVEEEAAAFWATSEGLVASLLLGSLGTAIGGFYAAYKAGTLEMKHGALVGVGSIIMGLFLQSGGSENQIPEWFMALSFAAAIPAGALGGFFAEMLKGITGGRSSSGMNLPGR